MINYTVTNDGVFVANPVGLTQTVTFTTAGAHTLTLTATNQWGTSGAASLTINIVVPGPPRNLRITP